MILALILVAVDEWKASTPKEFCESVIAAFEKKDFASLWDKGMSKALREEACKTLKDMQKRAKEDKDFRALLKKELGVGDDWVDLEPKDAWVAVMKLEAEEDPEETKYISDEVDGDKATLKITERKLKKKKETDPDPRPVEKVKKLVKEDGMWKLAE